MIQEVKQKKQIVLAEQPVYTILYIVACRTGIYGMTNLRHRLRDTLTARMSWTDGDVATVAMPTVRHSRGSRATGFDIAAAPRTIGQRPTYTTPMISRTL